jgi:hypothetical protein
VSQHSESRAEAAGCRKVPRYSKAGGCSSGGQVSMLMVMCCSRPGEGQPRTPTCPLSLAASRLRSICTRCSCSSACTHEDNVR